VREASPPPAEPDVLTAGRPPRPVARAGLLLVAVLLIGALGWMRWPEPASEPARGAPGVWLGVQQVRATFEEGLLEVRAVLGNHSVDELYVQLRPEDQPGPRAVTVRFSSEGWLERSNGLVPAPMAYIGPGRTVRVITEYDVADCASVSRAPAHLVLRRHSGEMVRVPFGGTWRQLAAPACAALDLPPHLPR
jgi:hypothetical protein